MHDIKSTGSRLCILAMRVKISVHSLIGRSSCSLLWTPTPNKRIRAMGGPNTELQVAHIFELVCVIK